MTLQSRLIWIVLSLFVICSVCAQVSANLPPNVIITKSPASPVIGQAIVFDATGSKDPEGGKLTFLWTFVDEGIEKSGSSVTYSYSTEGSKTILLTVTDDLGARTWGSAIINVNPTPIQAIKPVKVTNTTPTEEINATINVTTQVTLGATALVTTVPRRISTNGGESPSSGVPESGTSQISPPAPANTSPAGSPVIIYVLLGAMVLVIIVLLGIVFVKRQR